MRRSSSKVVCASGITSIANLGFKSRPLKEKPRQHLCVQLRWHQRSVIHFQRARSTCLPRIFCVLKSHNNQSSLGTKRFSLPSHFFGNCSFNLSKKGRSGRSGGKTFS